MNKYLDFLWLMTEKEIRLRYKHTALGFLWLILSPVIQMVIIGFIFSHFVNISNYYLFILSGLILWQFFTYSLIKSTPSFINERTILHKAKFPREIIPISMVLSQLPSLVISLLLLPLVVIFSNQKIPINPFFILLGLTWIICLTAGISLLTSVLNARYRDINLLVQSLTTFLFYVTPILYGLENVPSSVRFLFLLNPLTSIFELIRIGILGYNSVSDLPIFIFGNLIITLIIVFLGIAVLKRKGGYIVDWV